MTKRKRRVSDADDAKEEEELESAEELSNLESMLELSEFDSSGKAEQNEKYEKLEKIGEGSYGEVYKARGKDSGDMVALKIIKLDCQDEGIPPSTLREISILKQLKHECIVDLKNSWVNKHRKMILVFEFVEQDLAVLLRKLKTDLPIIRIKRFLFQLCCGIYHCHKSRILHRDLKPANLFIGENDVLKIGDFGLGITHSIPVQHLSDPNEVVTLYYRAPELLLGTRKYTGAIDMWSIGCIMGEMHKLRTLFEGDSEIHQMFLIFESLGTPTEATWPGVSKLCEYQRQFPRWQQKQIKDLVPQSNNLGWDFMARCLTYHPLKRISARDAMEHQFFDEIRDEYPYARNVPMRPRKRRKVKNSFSQ